MLNCRSTVMIWVVATKTLLQQSAFNVSSVSAGLCGACSAWVNGLHPGKTSNDQIHGLEAKHRVLPVELSFAYLMSAELNCRAEIPLLSPHQQIPEMLHWQECFKEKQVQFTIKIWKRNKTVPIESVSTV